MRNFKISIGLICLLIANLSFATERADLEPLDKFPHTQLAIATTDAKIHRFDVWIAENDKQREQGLMFVKSMPADRGMLFVYDTPQSITMWMKNTFIPLDMVFIRADGHVAHIAANTKPKSLAHIEAGENVIAVLELNGGTAAKLGITKGAIVMHRAFGREGRQ